MKIYFLFAISLLSFNNEGKCDSLYNNVIKIKYVSPTTILVKNASIYEHMKEGNEKYRKYYEISIVCKTEESLHKLEKKIKKMKINLNDKKSYMSIMNVEEKDKAKFKSYTVASVNTFNKKRPLLFSKFKMIKLRIFDLIHKDIYIRGVSKHYSGVYGSSGPKL